MSSLCNASQYYAVNALLGSAPPSYIASFGNTTVENVAGWIPIYQNVTSPACSVCWLHYHVVCVNFHYKFSGFMVTWWRCGAMSIALDLQSIGRRFKSYSGQCCVTILGMLSTPMCLCHQAVYLCTGQRAVMLCGWEGNCRPGRK